jgi:sucrose synthase
MLDVLKSSIREQREAASALFQRYLGFGRPYLLHSELWDEFQQLCREDAGSGLRASGLARVIHSTQESVVAAPWIYLAARPQLARWSYLRVHLETLEAAEVSVSAFLAFKEGPVLKANGRDSGWTLEFDIEPFNREFRRLQETRLL